jgi:hypothetical protein
MLPRGDRPGVKAPEPTVADFGGGKKHKKKGGKGGVYGDFMGGDWDIAEGGSWTPGAGGAAPWGSAEASPAVAAAMAGVASADAYPSQVSASMAQPSGGKAAIVVENVEIIIEGSRMSAQEVGDAVADALRGTNQLGLQPGQVFWKFAQIANTCNDIACAAQSDTRQRSPCPVERFACPGDVSEGTPGFRGFLRDLCQVGSCLGRLRVEVSNLVL